MECANARLPGGCGKTIHCVGCAIRRAVTHTFLTGKSHLREPAWLDREKDGKVTRLALLVSTEKRESCVLLRIDSIAKA
jgi:hypothetical protein